MVKLDNRNFIYVACFALFISLLAVLVKFDGVVNVQITPLGLRVVVNGNSAKCLIDTQPEVHPKLPEQREFDKYCFDPFQNLSPKRKEAEKSDYYVVPPFPLRRGQGGFMRKKKNT
ncbi:hypothetical protein [Nostoc sp.]|uniref:hypothetical protein n=1 Tax=Nostoc sp. TaxID=1180 RepID=UPI002FF97A98